MKLLAFAASVRQGSLNRQLLGLVVERIKTHAVEIDVAEFGDIVLPLYDGNVEATTGIPQSAATLAARIIAADGLVIISPEYNFSVPGTLKNTIDWLSRCKPMPLRGKVALLASASPSLAGGNRGLWALRVPLEVLGVHAYPDMFSLAQAHQAFDDDGQLKDSALNKMLERIIAGFVSTATALARRPS
jgi:NAD(P)H-dependent FMN reductase